jgi:hypothetical protein
MVNAPGARMDKLFAGHPSHKLGNFDTALWTANHFDA